MNLAAFIPRTLTPAIDIVKVQHERLETELGEPAERSEQLNKRVVTDHDSSPSCPSTIRTMHTLPSTNNDTKLGLTVLQEMIIKAIRTPKSKASPSGAAIES